MTFEEILDQAIAMLQRRGRVAYSLIKRQFDLDDEQLDDLKDAMMFAYPVTDETGRGLVWSGYSVSPETSPTSQPAREPVALQEPPPQVSRHPNELTKPAAERRQLTVMFCDLVDSTSLSGQLDPEDLRDIVRAYQTACAEVVQRYEGHVAQLLGDGLLIYFGFPQAHEDDPRRAIHAGLGIIEAMETLNTSLSQSQGVQLAVRLGIHTGLVVVGEMGDKGRREQLALGDTPNIAARIQGLAAPNWVVISRATDELVQGFFDTAPLGEHVLKGVDQPISLYRVLQESKAQSRFDSAGNQNLTLLVGRESERVMLVERWQRAKDGHGQVMLLSGEAGIGKSRLVQVLKDLIADETHTRLECRSSPYHQNTSLYPMIDLLQRTFRWQGLSTREEKVEALEQVLGPSHLSLAETVPLLAALLSQSVPEDRYPPLELSPHRQRQKTLELLITLIVEQAERRPLAFILEDLHWADATTLELMGMLIDQVPTSSIFMLLTCRPTFQSAWGTRSYFAEMTVNRLSRDQIEQVATEVAHGRTLPAEIIGQLVDRTDGVPLYVEEVTKAVLESGILKEATDRYDLVGDLASLTIPATLQDSLMSRLDRLRAAKVIAQLGATIGRQFSYELLQAVSQLDDVTLQHELGRLVEAELVYQRGLPPHATYTFKHALIQD